MGDVRGVHGHDMLSENFDVHQVTWKLIAHKTSTTNFIQELTILLGPLCKFLPVMVRRHIGYISDDGIASRARWKA
jgi:hypothetical protein